MHLIVIIKSVSSTHGRCTTNDGGSCLVEQSLKVDSLYFVVLTFDSQQVVVVLVALF